MQCQMQFFEVIPKGVGQSAGSQKVAVKMPAGDGDNVTDTNAFSEMIAALTRLPADQLRQSLAQLDSICLDGQNKEWVPLIDLTQVDETGDEMLELIQMHPQTEAAVASIFQVRIQPLDASNASVQPGGEEMSKAAGAENLGPTVQENPTISFAALQEDGDVAPVQTAKHAVAAEWVEAFDAQQHRIAQPRRLDINDSPVQDDPAGNQPQAKIANPSPAVSAQMPAPRQQGDPDPEGIVPGIMEKTTDATQKSTAVPHSPAVEKPADMKVSIDTTLADPRPIKKEQASINNDRLHGLSETVADGHAHAGNETTGTTTAGQTAQTASTSAESLQSVDTRPGGVETHAARQASENRETTAAPKEIQTDVIRQIVQRMTLHTDGRHSQMQIKLKPEFLGNLHMEVVTENQQVTVRMTAESQAVKAIIEQNLHVLKNELQQHGLQIQKFDVYVAQDKEPWRDSQQQAAFRQSQERGRRAKDNGDWNTQSEEESGTVDSLATPKRAYGERGGVDFFA